ncbi:M56 family metallopeptidase [Sphingosinicella rhizophila]|uniref:M56 family metallopeptidase n=1 Tax=Sphingosinicella rhizophila TaxID=3050082 RepID=A0ABU3QAY4_9SPHN|nr:M56 family metallopeptidase [Sphingosinicella sp. GR2756]MDT9600564.1 M56 family metallopeptidase [Sphingosinicella sp. GR2756]
MMDFLLPLAAKSLLIAGATLVLLKLMQRRSASDRSWIAHLGLTALLLLPAGTLMLPTLDITGPAFLTVAAAEPVLAEPALPATSTAGPEALTAASPSDEGLASVSASPAVWGLWAYFVPVVLLLLLTLVALLRLGALKARANVLVDGHWLQALARAQRRMGFKNGTALLTSDDLGSPISWGLMRPVILLNSGATEARGEAEAIIAHELAHIARLDWAKLMLARVTTALFWFNPLVWLLAREAHQLREEAADDAVLAADIEDTDYANLLVGIARHECRGLLLGAHGVAPGRGSLARRVKRVLDVALERAPGGWRWSSAAAFFAAGMVVPVAALQLVAPARAGASADLQSLPIARPAPRALDMAAPVGRADGGAMEADPEQARDNHVRLAERDIVQAAAPVPDSNPGRDRDRDLDPDPGANIIFDADAGMMRIEADSARIALQGRALAQRMEHDAAKRAIKLKALGANREYVAAIRRSAPQFRDMEDDELASFKALGVTPEYIVAIRRIAPEYLDISAGDLMAFRAVGITAEEVRRYRQAGRRAPSADQIVSMKVMGVRPEDLDRDDGS